jgi:ABC-2 type transport system permease protein
LLMTGGLQGFMLGLDPRSCHTMWQIIRDLVTSGVTIFLTTQYLDEADELANQIAVLNRGKLVAEGTPDELKRRIPGRHIQLQFADTRGLEAVAHRLCEVVRNDEALTLQIPTDGSVRSLKAVLDRLDHETSAVDGGGSAYINYLAPGIFVMTVGGGCAVTALNLCTDMAEGIITRFRTMAIFRASVLLGQVLGSLIRTLISVGLVTLVALLMGFRPSAGPVAWITALGLIVLVTLAITWMGVVFGLIGKTPAGSNSLSLIFQLLAYTSSAFVSTASMAAGVRWFAQYQPFTPVIDTLWGLLLGAPIGGSSIALAVAWCVAFTMVGYLWARAIYYRGPVR